MDAVEKGGGPGVGAQLRAAREARQLGLGDVAERLKLSVRQLEAIERDDFAALPGATFVRGFVRNYARFLELDPAPLMHALDQAFPPQPAENAIVREAESGRESVSRSGAGRWIGGALLVGVLAGSAWWFAGSGADDAADETLAPMAASAPSGIVESPDESMASAPAQDAIAAQASSGAQGESAQPPADSADTPVATAAVPSVPAVASAPAAAVAGALRLAASEDAWISVTDAKGQKLMFGTLKAGEQKSVSGTPPYRVRIGNASKVQVIHNGQPVDMSGKIRGSTATLTLD
ncbi:RodZ domain-containing protein [Crenobacter intestini]|uniref:Helix-turn-helix domain-containing protein n=1 Tax=Crenobacter intestini TaxID=2563443 RepID=A0A4V4N7X7_9NEIS|nr:RodZ domain-containing protein [Crenobacter intestini]TIC82303.1 helix-turn-helix domain-containing protein [Crenobacter intestini]